MNIIRYLAKQPLKESVIIFIVSLAILIVLSYISMTFFRLAAHDIVSKNPSYLYMSAQTILSSLMSITRTIFNISVIALIIQVVYKFKKRY